MPRRAAKVLVSVAIAAALNYFVASFTGDVVFNVGRAVIAFLGGWLMVSSSHKSLWMAALTGPVVLVVDHVILKGGVFVLAHYFWPAAVEGKDLLAAGGVLVSFLMFLPFAILSSSAGGFFARRKNSYVAEHP